MFGIFTAIASAVTSVISAVSSTIGPVLANVAKTVVTTLPKLLTIENIAKVVQIASDIITGISRVFGLCTEDEKTEEIGAKTMQEGTRPQRPNESTEEYLGYLRTVPLDKEKFDKMSETEKIAASAIGTGILIKNIDEKYHVAVTPDFIAAVHKTAINYEQAAKIIESFEKNKIESTKDFADYMGNELSVDKITAVSASVKEALQEMNPEATDEVINREIVSMKQEYNKAVDAVEP